MRSPEGSWGSVASPSLSSSHSPGLCLPQCPAPPPKLTLCIRPPWEGQTSSSNPDSRWMHWASCRSGAHLCPTSPPPSLEGRHRWGNLGTERCGHLLRVIQPGSGIERTRTQTSCLQGSHTTPPPSAWNSSRHEVNWGTDDTREEKSEFSRRCSASWGAGAAASPSQKRWAEARTGLVHKPASKGLVHTGEEIVPGRCWPVNPRDTPKASQSWCPLALHA